MVTKDDITEMVKYHKTKKVFEPQYVGGKTTENAKKYLSSFNNYCKLNKIDVVSLNPTTLSETIQRILLGEATLSFDNNEHIIVVSKIEWPQPCREWTSG